MAALNKKGCVLASRHLEQELSGMSKHCLTDLVVDLARGELGEFASDEAVLEWIFSRAEPVLFARGDRTPRRRRP
jgi:hypothetical protein